MCITYLPTGRHEQALDQHEYYTPLRILPLSSQGHLSRTNRTAVGVTSSSKTSFLTDGAPPLKSYPTPFTPQTDHDISVQCRSSK